MGTMEEAAAIAEKRGCQLHIEMVIHRWFSPFNPDNATFSKAKALIEWAKYRWSCGIGIFFWIDYSCIDQDDIRLGRAMMPLYVAACNSIMCLGDCWGRSWCLLERLMFAAFVGPNAQHVSIDFKFLGDAKRQPFHNEKIVLARPDVLGQVSYAGDKPVILELVRVSQAQW